MHPTSLDRRRFLLIAGALPALAACASRTPSRAATPGTFDVGLVMLPNVAKVSITIDKHPDTSSGLARALLFSGDVAKGEHLLTEALYSTPLAGPHFLQSLSDSTTQALLEALHSAGRSALLVPEPHRDRVELLPDYPSLGARAALIADVIPRSLGYWAEYPARIYRPWVRLEYREFDARAGKSIATGFVGTGPTPGDGAWSLVASDDAFAFATFEALVADPAKAAEGLRATATRVAQALAPKI